MTTIENIREDVRTFDHLIDGQWVPSVSKELLDVSNPATGEVIARIQKGCPEDVDKAAQAADRAFEEWASKPAKERARLMHEAANLVRKNVEYLSRMLTAEMGKPLCDARKEVIDSASVLDFFAEEGIRKEGEVAPLGIPTATSLVVKEPVGVCAAIAPWNYPISLLAWKIGPALAAGCTMVCKPASETPTAPLEFIRFIHEAGFPNGVINAVTGRGSVVGTAMVENPLVKRVAFTGTGSVGIEIMERAAKTLKRVSLELGGHSPFVVCADANFEKAVKDGVKRSFRNMGQICNAVNRIYVEESIYEKYLNRFVEETKKMTIGDGLENPNVDLGPMLNQAGIDKSVEHIQDAVKKGARLLCGGKHPEGSQYKTKLFYEPTVLADCTLDMLVMFEETFGPVVGIAPFKDIDDAIRLANSTEFGLVSYVYTSTLKNARALGRGIKSGTVCINNIVGSTTEAPYPGWKHSGIGFELSRHALDEYLLTKHIRIEV
jgi:succinate-semialdehyde dehydrogenase / glutarate-semialdehyde dehydrogenase